MWIHKFCVCSFFVLLNVWNHANAQDQCETPNGDTGRCVSIYSCQTLLNVVRSRDPEVIRFLRESNCGYQSNPLVCCGRHSSFHRGSSSWGSNEDSGNSRPSTNHHNNRGSSSPSWGSDEDSSNSRPSTNHNNHRGSSSNSWGSDEDRSTTSSWGNDRDRNRGTTNSRDRNRGSSTTSSWGNDRDNNRGSGSNSWGSDEDRRGSSTTNRDRDDYRVTANGDRNRGSTTTTSTWGNNRDREQTTSSWGGSSNQNGNRNPNGNRNQNNSGENNSSNRNPNRNNNNNNSNGNRNNNLPDRQSCGRQTPDKILGGEATSPDEFPWMALLQYRRSNGDTPFACGGSLISSRYVLTAAHCVTGKILTAVGRLYSVRLGEWDTQTDRDCQSQFGIQSCNDPPVDVQVENGFAHPKYNDSSINRYNDIALVRLRTNVRFSNFIRPICLPTVNDRASTSSNLYVAGWGKTEYASSSDKKLKVKVPIADSQQCLRRFKSAGVTLADTQLCAGGEAGKDSCSGDSGGPLMTTFSDDGAQWYVEGVVSFGAKCGLEGWPGIYTKVSKYIDWINQNVEN